MLARVRSWWADLVDGFWFVPGVTALAYVLLAVAAIRIDREAGTRGFDFAFQGDADAARDILTTIAGSLITVAGLAFSLTIVVLSLVSSQFSPRAVRSLLADRTNQVVAGSFVGIFAYCLVVLRTVRSETSETSEFVPALGVTVAIVLALIALGLLLAFIHNAGTSIQVSRIAARIGGATLEGLDRLYPEPCGAPVSEEADPVDGWRSAPADVVAADRVGFVQAIVLDDLLDVLESSDRRVHVAVRPGDFLTERTVAVEVWPGGSLSSEQAQQVRRTLVVAEDRDLRQDPAYGLRQLADIALRALSPGVNDPTTATNCIAYLGAALERLAARDIPSSVRRDPETGAVVVVRRWSFEDYAREAFAEIGRYASDNARVVAAALGALSKAARAARRAGAADRIAVIRRVGDAMAERALADARTEDDRTEIQLALARLEAVSDGIGESTPG